MKYFFKLALTVLLVASGLTLSATSAPAATPAGGPIVLMGIDAEDGGVGAHGPIANYITLVDSVLEDVTNGNTGGILVLGSDGTYQTGFWNAIAAGVDASSGDGTAGEPVTYVDGETDLGAVDFSAYEILVVSGSDFNTFDGLTDAENDVLASRKLDFANFVNAGGGLIGLDQGSLTNQFGYLGTVGSFTSEDRSDFADIEPTPDGQAVGVDNNLDVCCWHQIFTEYPSFLTILAYQAATTNVVALGGESVVVPPEDCANGVDDDNDGLIDGADPDCQTTTPTQESVSGTKYYDANANGQWDAGEPGIGGWPVDLGGDSAAQTLTDPVGAYSFDVDPGTFTLAERQAAAPWMQTGNIVDQSTGTGDVTLNADETYTVALDAGETASDLDFGNLCIGGVGAKTKGFWQNKNGQAAFTGTDSGVASLALVNSLNLKKADGGDADFTNYTQFRNWIRDASAKNSAYMLSAQLAAMALNEHVGYIDGTDMVQAAGATSANALGFASVTDLIAEADAALGAATPDRAYQLLLSGIIDAANNDGTFVERTPGDCPVPRFSFLFEDDFDAENGGVGVLNYTGFANWGVTGGTVDLIGNGFFDFYPGNGLYVDLDGSTGDAGVLTTTMTFALPEGSYQLGFDLGGSQRGDSNDVTVALGGLYTDTFTLGSADPLSTVSVPVAVPAGGALVTLSFENAGGDNTGAILDNVTLASVG